MHATCAEGRELTYPVVASDRRVYDAFALQRWLQHRGRIVLGPHRSPGLRHRHRAPVARRPLRVARDACPAPLGRRGARHGEGRAARSSVWGAPPSPNGGAGSGMASAPRRSRSARTCRRRSSVQVRVRRRRQPLLLVVVGDALSLARPVPSSAGRSSLRRLRRSTNHRRHAGYGNAEARRRTTAKETQRRRATVCTAWCSTSALGSRGATRS